MLTLSLDLQELQVPGCGLHAKLEGKGEPYYLYNLHPVKAGVQLGSTVYATAVWGDLGERLRS